MAQFSLRKNTALLCSSSCSAAALMEDPSYFTLCSALLPRPPTLTAGVPLGQAMPISVTQCGVVQLFLNAISNIHFPDSISRNLSCDLHLLTLRLKYLWNQFYFCSIFLLHEFLLFLLEFLIGSGFLFSFISTNPVSIAFEL